MTRLSVNINKIATLRNSRGGNIPNVVEAAINCQKFGADGITVHPRPDERHIKYQDVFDLKKIVKTEFNIEGFPTEKFIDLVLNIKPDQVTLVPDAHNAITSNAGWDIKKNKSFLKEISSEFKNNGIRVSIFVETDLKNIELIPEIEADRIELYTEPYAAEFNINKEKTIQPFREAAKLAQKIGIGLNAGHDLNLENLNYFYKNIPGLLEVSIGHALISEAIYLGLENTIQMYLNQLK